MKTLPTLRRFALAVALVPQLLFLGLGRGVVVCVAPGGHLEVELAAADGCADSRPAAPAVVEASCVDSHEGLPCGPCSDFGFVVDPRPGRESDAVHELPALAAARPLPAPKAAPPPVDPHGGAERAPPRVSPVLGCLATVRLRC